MNFNALKAICMTGCIIPSYSVFAGLLGATPLGIFLTPFFLRRASVYFIIFFFIFIVISILQLNGLFDFVNALLLLAPIFIYLFFFQFSSFKSYTIILDLILGVFLLEAIIGGLFFSDGIRSTVFITLEPSHSSRAFFAAAFLRSICLRSKRELNFLILISAIFVFANKSLSGFLMFLPLLIANRRLIIYSFMILLIILSSGVTPDRVRSLQSGIQDFSDVDADSLVIGISAIGSRRLVQALSAYENSRFLGGVGAGRGDIELVNDSANSLFSLKAIEERLRSESVNIGPSSYMAQISYEYGSLVAIFLLWCLCVVKNLNYIGWLWFFSAIMQLLFFSSTLMPTPWIILGILAGLQGGYISYPDKLSRELYPLINSNR